MQPSGVNRVVVIGDSYITQPTTPWPRLIADRLGIETVIRGEGGSGYVNPGTRGTVFRQKIPGLLGPEDALVVFIGSRNDKHSDTATLESAVADTYSEAKRAAPNADLLVVGPIYPEGNPPSKILEVRDILRAQAEQVGATFVDPIAEGWLNDPSLVQEDGIQPNQAGNEFIAQRMAPLIRERVPLR